MGLIWSQGSGRWGRQGSKELEKEAEQLLWSAVRRVHEAESEDCYRLNYVLPKDMLKSLVPQNMTLSVNRVIEQETS